MLSRLLHFHLRASHSCYSIRSSLGLMCLFSLDSESLEERKLLLKVQYETATALKYLNMSDLRDKFCWQRARMVVSHYVSAVIYWQPVQGPAVYSQSYFRQFNVQNTNMSMNPSCRVSASRIWCWRYILKVHILSVTYTSTDLLARILFSKLTL